MPDMEKLTDAMNDVKAVENFLRKQGESWYADILSDAFDTLAMLREQELVRPPAKVQRGNRIDCFCRNCTTKVGMLFLREDAWRFHYNFCPYCGRKVKWDD